MANQTRVSKVVLSTTLVVIVLAVAFAAISMIPVPYVIHRPGPTVNVLGSQGSTQVFEFSVKDQAGLPAVRPASENEGQLRMVTVSESGGPGTTVRLIDLIEAKFDRAATVIPYDQIYDKKVTAKDVEQAGAAQMTSSHSAATIAAFEYLGIPMESTLTIEGASDTSDAKGKVEQGDILRSLRTPDGIEHPVDRPSVPFALVAKTPPGTKLIATIERDGKQIEVPIVTAGPEPGGPKFEGSRMGIYLSADTKAPIDVKIHLERIGGPSAGLIFALGIVNRLSDHDITRGQVIAGTGAMSFTGDVLPIGGVKQKMFGAKRDGAKWFLAPKDNCDEVVGNVPSGLTVIPVGTLAEAVGVVEQIGDGTTSGFLTCESVLQEAKDARQS